MTVKAAAVDTNPPADLGMHATPLLLYFLTKYLADNPETLNGFPQCKPLLQSCSVNSECCADLCALGVSVPLSEFRNLLLRCSDYSFALNWRGKVVPVCVPHREFRCSCCSHSVAEPPCRGPKMFSRRCLVMAYCLVMMYCFSRLRIFTMIMFC
jgi:hypothetical protein